jgi:ubiquinone/menaquinone biosynthesis C-methylase UbiE
MPGVSFDRAADYYDATRGYPAGVDDELRQALVDALGASYRTRFLELGVGTGRIALPFIRAGYDYTGVDLSRAMMARLRAKVSAEQLLAARYRLVAGDVMRVPLAGDAFDAAVMVHVLHLVDEWRAVLDEVRRLLRPGGKLALANDEHVRADPPTPPEQVWAAWSNILDQLAVPPEQRRAAAVRGLDQRFDSYLEGLGATVERVTLIEHQTEPRSARGVVREYRDRIFSSCWALPDEVHAEASRRLERWLSEESPDPDGLYPSVERVEALIASF